MNRQRYYYKDFATGKQRWTRGRFVGWQGSTGPLNAIYAQFQRGRDSLFVPEYLLAPETRLAIAKATNE